MRAVHTGPALGLIAQVVLLAAVAATVGLGGSGWVVGIACGVVTNALLARGLVRSRAIGLGPADKVTLARATLAGGVAALAVDSFQRPAAVTTLVLLTAVALVLDAVDGWVARRTHTSSALGARFDMEVDAFLILVLSVYVARAAGAWVLAIGAARYVFVAAGWLLPWMRAPLPPRHWRKVVAAIQGVVLTFAVAGVLPARVMTAVLAASLALLAESFGRDVWWLWRHRPVRVGRAGATTVAVLLVWLALVSPDEIRLLTPLAFARIPIEGLLVVALALVLPARARRAMAALAGTCLGLLTIVKLLDMGFYVALGRPFNPVSDWGYVGSGAGLLSQSVGRSGAVVVVVGAGLAGVALLVLMPLSVLRVTRLVDRHRARSIRVLTVLGVVWTVGAVLGLQLAPGASILSAGAADLAYRGVSQVRSGVHDRQAFAKMTAADRFRDTPGDALLTGLRGKDVVVAFVESYGRVAVEGSPAAGSLDAALDAGTKRLRAAGFASRSAFLTSPTFGGLSWLAHSTLQSGLWIDSQQRYDDVVASDRLTLSGAFRRAGWRTVFDVPSNEQPWPQGASFYRYDKLYDAHDVGYAGPKFSYAAMPDQYILSAFQRLELAAPHHDPVMAEIDLVSSHTPWAPLPHLVDWRKVGDGSVFDVMAARGEPPYVVWRDPVQVRNAYHQSIAYSMDTLVSFVQTFHDDNLVLVVLGDHQPATIVSGQGASHDVPVTVIAHDPAVIDRISGWGWQEGLRPGRTAPVWPMDAFRDRFLTAYGPPPAASPVRR